MQRHRDHVRAAARDLGWPEPVIYPSASPAATRTGTGTPLDALASAIVDGHHDAVITTRLADISRDTTAVDAFVAQCLSNRVAIHLTGGERINSTFTDALWSAIGTR